MTEEKREVIIKDGKINWMCLGANCPANCCGSSSEVLHGSKPKSWEPLKDIPENTVPASGSKNLPKEGLCDFGDGAIHICQTDESGCHFLCSEGCSVYQDRATSCRTYPFFLDKYQGPCIDVSCPGFNAGWTSVEKVAEIFERLASLYVHQAQVARKFLMRHAKQ